MKCLWLVIWKKIKIHYSNKTAPGLVFRDNNTKWLVQELRYNILGKGGTSCLAKESSRYIHPRPSPFVRSYLRLLSILSPSVLRPFSVRQGYSSQMRRFTLNEGQLTRVTECCSAVDIGMRQSVAINLSQPTLHRTRRPDSIWFGDFGVSAVKGPADRPNDWQLNLTGIRRRGTGTGKGDPSCIHRQ